MIAQRRRENDGKVSATDDVKMFESVMECSICALNGGSGVWRVERLKGGAWFKGTELGLGDGTQERGVFGFCKQNGVLHLSSTTSLGGRGHFCHCVFVC